MPSYDALHYDPPAPIAQVMLRAPNGATVPDVVLLLDTGADATLLPRSAVTRLGLNVDPSLRYDLVGFDGSRSTTQAVDLDMIFLQKAFRGRYLLIDSERGIPRPRRPGKHFNPVERPRAGMVATLLNAAG